jgi:hypothetical protein
MGSDIEHFPLKEETVIFPDIHIQYLSTLEVALPSDVTA